jgi:lipopolysaccharide/colanic/teichoic acid biosynthesis glycosyltransferase
MPDVTTASDPRITQVCALLRRMRVDELPKLWSLVRGGTSIVGPRPEVERHVRQYWPELQRLFDVRHGLTDLASLTFRNEEGMLGVVRSTSSSKDSVLREARRRIAELNLETA